MSTRKTGCLSILLAAACALRLAAEPPPPPIVPWPKDIKLESTAWRLEGKTVIAIAPNSPEQVRIGAGIIKDKLCALGVDCAITNSVDMALAGMETLIQIGVCGQDAGFDRKLREAGANVEPTKPGAQGYAIRCLASSRPKLMLVAGCDAIGALYGCVTAAQLLQDGGAPALVPAQVADWPDIKNRWLGSPRNQGCYGNVEKLFKLAVKAPDSKEFEAMAAAHVERVKKYIDWLLGLKVNGFDIHTKPWGDIWVETYPIPIRKLMREINDYAHIRGMKLFFYDCTALIPSVQGYFQEKWWEGVKLNNATGRNKYLCWSRDDLVLRKAAGIGKFMADTGMDMVMLHGTDAGGDSDPEVWSQRCDRCRKKWGNDRVKASAHLYNTFIAGIRKECPEAGVTLTQYPYWISQLGRKIFSNADPTIAYLEGMAAIVDSTAPLTIREQPADATRRFQSICGKHPVFTYFEMCPGGGRQTDFSTAFRYMKTFYDPNRPQDIMWPSNEGKTLLTFMGATEFAWDTGKPGAADWLPASIKDGEGPEVIFKENLPRYCRSIWGDKFGGLMATPSSQNVGWQYVLDPGKMFKAMPGTSFEDIELMRKQRDGAAKAADALVTLIEQVHADPAALPEHRSRRYPLGLAVKMIFLRQMAEAHCLLWELKRLLKEGKHAEAEAWRTKAIAELDAAPAEIDKQLKKIESPTGPLKYKIPKNSYWVKPVLEKTAAIKAQIEKINCAPKESIWTDAAEGKIRDRVVCAARTDQAPNIDGKLDDEVWQSAPPTEFFVLYKKGLNKPAGETRFRVLYDVNNLYVGFQAFVNQEQPVAFALPGRDVDIWGQDSVEVFFAPDCGRGVFYQFGTTPLGAIYDSRDRSNDRPFRSAWNAKGLVVATSVRQRLWEGEMLIPFNDLDAKAPAVGDVWATLMVRNIGAQGGALEISSILPDITGFLSPELYPKLVFIGPAGKQAPPLEDIVAVGPKLADKTFADMVTSVASASFQLKAKAILHNVVLSVSALDAKGGKVGDCPPIKIDVVPFLWVTPYPLELKLTRELDEVQLQVKAESVEGTIERSFVIKK